MPNYDYQCNKCEFFITDVQLPIAARYVPTTEPCPNCHAEGTVEMAISAPGVSYTANRGGLKTPESFKDILRNIKAQNPGSTLNVD